MVVQPLNRLKPTLSYPFSGHTLWHLNLFLSEKKNIISSEGICPYTFVGVYIDEGRQKKKKTKRSSQEATLGSVFVPVVPSLPTARD